jgi:hypothetical protein
VPRVDQRHIPTAQYKVPGGRAGSAPAAGPASNPEDETDPSAPRLDDAAVASVSQWRFNALGAVLGTALICALLVSVGLFVKLQRTRAELAEAELAAEMAEAALARDPDAAEDKAEGKSRDDKPKAEERARPAPRTEPAARETAAVDLTARAATAAAAPGDQLVLLLTVGTRHYAEKQLRSLRKRCRAPLAVYQQRRGRCGWSQCWAVAVAAQDRELAKGCGAVKGQALRDRKDFLQLP